MTDEVWKPGDDTDEVSQEFLDAMLGKPAKGRGFVRRQFDKPKAIPKPGWQRDQRRKKNAKKAQVHGKVRKRKKHGRP
jgi:hypothetical protein